VENAAEIGSSLPGWKKFLRKPGCRNTQTINRGQLTIASMWEQSDNKTGRKQSHYGPYFPRSGVSGCENPDRTPLTTIFLAC
jgi:hypothetical protein